MRLHMIEGRHLTATNRRHIAEMIRLGHKVGRPGRLCYRVTPEEPNHYRVVITSNRSDDWGNMVHDRRTFTIRAEA